MTVRVTTLKGAEAGVYYVEQLPNYYLQSGEPRGVWVGAGADLLNLTGDVDDDAFLAVMAGMDAAHPDRFLGRRYGDTSARGFDVTCSAPKSVSVLFALGDVDTCRAVLAAHDAAVVALAGWIERHAHTRYRIGGEVATVDAEGIVAAMFRQHTSRALDPQVHTHLVIANRVRSSDGRWLAVDARLIKHDQRTLSAIYHAGLRAELTRRLGVRWQAPEHGIAEIVDVPADVLAMFSTRAHMIRRRIDDKLDHFHQSMGREPTGRERWRLEREAAIDSRPAKGDALDGRILHAHWAAQARQLGYQPARIVTNAIGRVRERRGIDQSTAVAIIERAMTTIAGRQSSWRPTELHREVAAAIPTETAVDAAGLVGWLDRVVDGLAVARCVDLSRPVPAGAMLRRDGRPVNESVLDRALTTRTILDQETAIIGWADRRLAYPGIPEPATVEYSRVVLNAAQADAAAAVAGTADLVLVVGPAGTGKTTALAPAVAQLCADGQAVFGVAPSATAAEVLREETGIDADTLDKLLSQHRLAQPPDPRYRLPVGTTLIVDEAGMLPTARLAELAAVADVCAWRIVLVGDPLQFSAVGRGGMFGLLVDTFGGIELERVHRFDHAWERAASLRLRRGDVEVADLYDTHGRLHGGTANQMERAAAAEWWQHRQAGASVLLMTPTNETVERLNQRCQQTRIRAGEINPTSRRVTVGGYTIHVGDEIATRRNDRRLVTDQGDTVRNRATWTITTIGDDGALTARGPNGTVLLPAGYVAEHVDLAYARTGTGSQGRTVKHAILYLDRASDVRNIYVPMTRGTTTNMAYIAVTGEQTAHDVFAHSLATDWIDQPAHTRHTELNPTTPHRPGILDTPVRQHLINERDQITTALADAERTLRRVPHERQTAVNDAADATRLIARTDKAIADAQEVLNRYDRPLRRGKHEHEISYAKRDLAILPETIRNARHQAAAATKRIVDLDKARSAAVDLLRCRPDLDAKLNEINDQLAADHRNRTLVASLEGPATATATVSAARRLLGSGPVAERLGAPSTAHVEPGGPSLGL